MKEKIYK